MANQQLIDYIKKSKATGRTDDQIKSSLRQSGWQDADIEEGFKLFPIKKLVAATIVIFILLAGGVFGFYYFNKSETPADAPTKTPEKKPPVETIKTKSPRERFLEFKSSLENAATYEEAVGFAKPYMSDTTDTKYLGYNQIDLTTEQKDQILAILKTAPPAAKDISEITEEINGASGKLLIKTKNGALCGLPIFLEDNQWKFGIMDCEEPAATQPSQPQTQNPTANTITSCGSVKYANIMNVDARTPEETAALTCMAAALTECASKTLTINRVQTTTYQIESKESQYCNISRNAGLKTTCGIPLTYISKYRDRYKSPGADDIFLQTILSSIDADGKSTDGRTGQTTTEFICQ